MGFPHNLIWFMILQAYSASSSVKNSQNPKPWCAIEMRSLGRCTLTKGDYMRKSEQQVKEERDRTDRTGLKHKFPNESISATFVEVALD
jgi:hypothetical protein